jgi:diguanylate cyclase (GGDEF)-like protein/PAS domain S-box-containing protein
MTEEHETFQEETWRQRKDGTWFWALVEIIAIRNDSGLLSGFCKLTRDITGRRQMEQALFREKARAEVTLSSIGDAVISIDVDGVVTYLNPAAERLTGWTKSEALGRSVTEVVCLVNSQTRASPLPHPMLDAIEHNAARKLDFHTMLVRRDGSEIPIEDAITPIPKDKDTPAGAGAVIVFRDVSASRALNAKMIHAASHDFLTGLPNRVLLLDRLEHEITRAQRQGTNIAVLFIDLDNFKNINDSLGHDVGDKLLQFVARKLCKCVRGMDTVSRLGGDEFVILLADNAAPAGVGATADKIRETLTQPFFISTHELYVTASIGAAVYPFDGADVSTLIKNADTAMYIAKEKGRNNCQFFDHAMNARATERQVVESNLRHALAKQQFVLHYQPKIDLATNEVTGAEALLRWEHPEWGMVLPERFITIAEECGLIVPIGSWVLREACSQAKRWLDAGVGSPSIAVNISALEFRQKNFLASVRDALSQTGLPPTCLQLEITESVVMHDALASVETMQKLKELGVRLAVDDFGTGYSSLSYLKNFPIDVLKIDQSFIRDITDHQEDGAIVAAIVVMGNSLKQTVVAEGVETTTQLAFLKHRSCAEGQGYLFSRPLTPKQFAAFTLKQDGPRAWVE